MPTPPLVSVDWIGSTRAMSGWEFMEDLEPLPPARCTTVGFLVGKTPDAITLAPTISQDQVCGRITIPRRAVLKQKQLRK